MVKCMENAICHLTLVLTHQRSRVLAVLHVVSSAATEWIVAKEVSAVTVAKEANATTEVKVDVTVEVATAEAVVVATVTAEVAVAEDVDKLVISD